MTETFFSGTEGVLWFTDHFSKCQPRFGCHLPFNMVSITGSVSTFYSLSPAHRRGWLLLPVFSAVELPHCLLTDLPGISLFPTVSKLTEAGCLFSHTSGFAGSFENGMGSLSDSRVQPSDRHVVQSSSAAAETGWGLFSQIVKRSAARTQEPRRVSVCN